ncbi:MAG: hypothetical protein ACRDHZ_24960, partial [Ktedonobacteraceae bacterium]
KYMESHATICPFCGDHDIGGGSFMCESAMAWQNVSCHVCGERWRDVYTLAFVETEDEFDAWQIRKLKERG